MDVDSAKKDLGFAVTAKNLGKCQGDCAECRGELQVVRVTHPSYDWGYFSYCDAAIEEDKSRGLVVTPFKESDRS